MTADAIGGVWTYCMELCRALAPYQVQVSMVTTGARLSSWQWQEALALKNVRVYETDFLLEWMDNPWRDIDDSGEYLLKLEEKIKPDLIHLNSYAYGSLAWKAPVVTVAHSDVYSWFRWVKNEDPSAIWNEYFFRVKKGLNKADLVIAPSHSMLNSLEEIYATTSEKKVIYNARQPQLFSRGSKEPTVLSIGRVWDEAKNIQLLLNAAQSIGYPIKIAGDINFYNNGIDLQNRNIEHLGKLDTGDIAKALSKASVFVLPARYEPFGLSALEAALSGCALVLGNIPSLREIWQDNALYVNPDDAGALAHTVNMLISDKPSRYNYAEKAYNHAQRFHPSIMAMQYMQAYRETISLSNSPHLQAAS